MNELTDLYPDLDINDFDLDIPELVDFDGVASKSNCRIHKPKLQLPRNPKTILYQNTTKLVRSINFEANDRFYIVVDGSFIFGDFIEAFIVENNILCRNLTISTLSMSDANVISLENLINGDYIEKLNLIISDYFYSHERRHLIPLIYKKLDVEDKFQLAVAGTHCKIVLIETEGGKKIVMHGSANLRSSGSSEQFMIEDNKELYEFNMAITNSIIQTYHTIDKSIRGRDLKKVMKNGKENSHIRKGR